MRAALIALVSIAVGSVSPTVLEARSASGVETSCRQFVTNFKQNRFYLHAAPDVMAFVQERDGFAHTLASECNVMALTRAECIANPGMRVVDALESLLSKDRKGEPMPATRACGA